MRSESMNTLGYLVIISGAGMVILSGAFFYNYVQQLLATSASSATGATSISEALSLYNNTSAAPVFMTLSILGVAFLIMGSVFLVGAHIGPPPFSRTMAIPPPPPTVTQSPARACTKCGTLSFQNVAYCPNCGNPLGRNQSLPESSSA